MQKEKTAMMMIMEMKTGKPNKRDNFRLKYQS